MFSKFGFLLRQGLRSIWFRPALFTVAALAITLITPVFDRFMPDAWEAVVEAETVDSILTILASSLLAVAIFSLSTMVAAFRAASDSATPRARPLVIEDETAQNAVATFIGAFLFSLLGIIGLATNLYDDTGQVMLFVMTLVLIAIVVVMLIRWIRTLSLMGDVGEAIQRVENAGLTAFKARLHAPNYGGRPARAFPQESWPVVTRQPGFVQVIDGNALLKVCEEQGVEIDIVTPIGAFSDPASPLARVTGELEEDAIETVRNAFVTGPRRTYASDPHFALIALAEIALRALSPGVNDPGTAVEAVRSIERTLLGWRQQSRQCEPEEPREGLYGPALDPAEMLGEPLLMISRDGAGFYEVGATLQAALAGLKAGDSEAFGKAADELSEEAFERARKAMAYASDVERLARKRRKSGFA
ncbi:DUF2254 domain-containing protein [Marinicauda sp. Alg238-R41]|uniref:DUF2254 domain-containing protein n=1 Tax=Marinicauda sp. Alg238-R41 TaxID=2993447 RepID=UPI0022E69B4F|nr:DUF2254 domain-containing protein [Marinicauda sp. Alg238-R41]